MKFMVARDTIKDELRALWLNFLCINILLCISEIYKKEIKVDDCLIKQSLFNFAYKPSKEDSFNLPVCLQSFQSETLIN